MKEFGSDFHLMEDVGYKVHNTLMDYYPNAVYYANGRQALLVALQEGGYKKLWVPVYFCYEVIEYIKAFGIKVALYKDFPLENNDNEIIKNIKFRDGDALLRVNYFGWRKWRDSTIVPVPVIEDHSHDLIGYWTQNSNADWCVASIRKTIAIPEGGMLWSPKAHSTHSVSSTKENDTCSYRRLYGMSLKKKYLEGGDVEKQDFREIFISTEDVLGNLAISGLAPNCLEILQRIDIKAWYETKRRNWKYIVDNTHLPIISSMIEDSISCTPFSVILKMGSHNEREEYRRKLIEHSIYPAILWSIPHDNSEDSDTAKIFSEQMLSIHCDGRYSLEDMCELSGLLNKLL